MALQALHGLLFPVSQDKTAAAAAVASSSGGSGVVAVLEEQQVLGPPPSFPLVNIFAITGCILLLVEVVDKVNRIQSGVLSHALGRRHLCHSFVCGEKVCEGWCLSCLVMLVGPENNNVARNGTALGSTVRFQVNLRSEMQQYCQLIESRRRFLHSAPGGRHDRADFV